MALNKEKLSEAFEKRGLRTAAAKVREVMPDIEHQIERGMSSKAIVAALNEAGLEVTQRNFEAILYRYRKKHGGQGVPAPARQTAPDEPQPPASADTAKAGTGVEGAAPEKARNESDRDAFEQSLDPVERDKFADKYMGRRRPFGTKNRSSK